MVLNPSSWIFFSLPVSDWHSQKQWVIKQFFFFFSLFSLPRKLPENKTTFFPHTRISFWSKWKHSLSPRKHIYHQASKTLAAGTGYILVSFLLLQFWAWTSLKTSFQRVAWKFAFPFNDLQINEEDICIYRAYLEITSFAKFLSS